MKRFEVIADNEAEDDLFDIYSYVALNDSFESADQLLHGLKRACLSLRTLPLRGHNLPELRSIKVGQFREIRHKPYRIIYSIEGEAVIIHCILDGRRDLQELLEERLLR